MKYKWPTLFGDMLILVVCMLVLVVISRHTTSQGSGYVQIQSSEATYRYSLDTNQVIPVHGP
ncbi:MAG: NusG domain II-containing protein, partial [Sphaerochaetaceae bacterium]